VTPWLEQGAGASTRVYHLDPRDSGEIETDNHDAAFQTMIADQLNDRATEIQVPVLSVISFHLDID
jgi:hypothetical protein